jgi:hypothetical protein
VVLTRIGGEGGLDYCEVHGCGCGLLFGLAPFARLCIDSRRKKYVRQCQ